VTVNNVARAVKQILVSGSCAGTSVRFFVDSGSSVSLVSSAFVRRIGAESSVRPTKTMLASFTNNSIPVKGAITLTVTIAGLQQPQDFIVTELLDTPFLIGLDYLQDKHITLDNGRRKLFSPCGECVYVNKPVSASVCMKIRCNRTVTVPSNTVQLLSGRLPQVSQDVQGVVEPYRNTAARMGVFMADALVSSEGRQVPIRCINTSEEDVTIYKGTLLGFLNPLITGDEDIAGVKAIREGEPTWRKQEESADVRKERWTKKELFEALHLDKCDAKLTKTERERLQRIVWENRHCFSYDKEDLGCCNMYTAKIDLKKDHSPRWTPSRMTPYKLQGEIDSQLRAMMATGVVEECTSRSNWNSPVFLVVKPNGGGHRFVADLRGVNMESVEDRFELPNLNHVLDTIGGDTIFSTCDMSSSFHQVPYDEASKEITAFTNNGKRYQFARMVMGHCSSSSSFTRMMYKLLTNVPITHLLYFVDDLLIGSRDVETHFERLEMLLKKLASANLKLTPRKTNLLRSEVKFVGVTLSAKGTHVNDDRIEAVKQIKEPRTVKEVQKVLGFFNFSRKFIRKYAEITRPLYRLLQMKSGQKKKFEWTEECQRAFDQLKTVTISSPTLCFPDVADPLQSYVVQLDGSKYGFGATLSQTINGEKRIVAYFSKATPRNKREWGQTKLEFLTMYQAITHWKAYLRGTKFRVITDCKSLLNIETIFATNNQAMVRKINELSNYRFEIEHVSAEENQVCDFLSRYAAESQSISVGTQTTESVVGQGDEPVSAVVREVREVDTLGSCVGIVSEVSSVDSVSSGGNVVSNPRESVINCNTNHSVNRVVSSPTVDVIVNRDVADYCDVMGLNSLFDQQGMDSNVTVQQKKEVVERCMCVGPRMPKLEEKPDISTVNAVSHVPDLQFSKPDLKSIAEEQKKDPILTLVREWVENKDRGKLQANRAPTTLVSYWKQFNLLKIENDLLKRRWVSGKEEEERYLILVPESQVEKILEQFHDNITSCHPGAAISTELCRRQFYWPGMMEEFKLYVSACTRCSEMKQPKKYLRAPLQHLFFHSFNDAICVDHIVPSANKKTPRGFRYILTISDCWSNFLVAVPVRTQTATENIRAIFTHWVLRHGMPREIIVDNHPGFTATFFSEVWRAFDCKKTHGTTYKSASTARAENNNKRVNQALRACLPDGKEHCWDAYLGYVTFALNSLNNRRTGYSSNKMVYGRELNMPMSLLVDGDKDIGATLVDSRSKEAYELHKKMKGIMRRVRRNAEVDFGYAQKYHDKNISGPFFKEGELCYVLVSCPKHKYEKRWNGPYMIVKVINDHLYVVQTSPGTESVTNISKMKKYPVNKYSRRVTEQKEQQKNGLMEQKCVEKVDSESESESECELQVVQQRPVSVSGRTRAATARARVSHQLTPPLQALTSPSRQLDTSTVDILPADVQEEEDEFFTDDEFDRLDEAGEVDYSQGRSSRRPGLRDRSMIRQPIRTIQQPLGGFLKSVSP